MSWKNISQLSLPSTTSKPIAPQKEKHISSGHVFAQLVNSFKKIFDRAPTSMEELGDYHDFLHDQGLAHEISLGGGVSDHTHEEGEFDGTGTSPGAVSLFDTPGFIRAETAEDEYRTRHNRIFGE